MASNDPTDTGGLFVGRRPGTAPLRYRGRPATGSARRRRADTALAAAILVLETLVLLTLWGPQPLGWLWVGSQVQGATDSLGLALLAMALGVAASIAALLRVLGWLNLQHIHARERRGLDTYGNVTLEGVMVTSAALALVSFCIWFFLFSGSSPFPVNVGF